jgi:hypothetical protein
MRFFGNTIQDFAKPALVAYLLVCVSACSAVSEVNDRRLAANEQAAILNLRAIQSAQVLAASQKGTYAGNLKDLGDLLAPDLANGMKLGYKFSVSASADGKKFTAIAVPETFRQTGRKSYLLDETGVMRVNEGAEPPTASSPEIQ